MPLHTEDEPPCRVFDGFDDAVGCIRNRTKIASGIRDRLMMVAIYFHLRFSREAGNETVFGDADHMAHRGVAVTCLMSNPAAHQCGNILNERSATKHIQALNPKANADQWQVLPLDVFKNRKICGVALRIKFADFAVRSLPIKSGIDICRTAGKKNTVDAADIFLNDVTLIGSRY